MVARGRRRAIGPGAWLGEARGGWEMGQRPKALGFASLLALLAALHVGTSAEAASVSRQCRRACRAELAACVGAGGHPRACRKSVRSEERRVGKECRARWAAGE